MSNKILIVTTNISKYTNANIYTGLWLSELTHFYDLATKNKFEITIASPKGGITPLDPDSLKPFMLDKLSKAFSKNEHFMKLLQETAPLSTIEAKDYDAIYLTGGHGTMFDFVGNERLNALIAEFFESGKIVSAICHGSCGLLDVKLGDGSYLVKDKTVTGFSWFEETLARKRSAVPFNLEKELKAKGGNYKKGFLPLTSYVCADKNLITGQNPFSSPETAKAVIAQLKGNG